MQDAVKCVQRRQFSLYGQKNKIEFCDGMQYLYLNVTYTTRVLYKTHITLRSKFIFNHINLEIRNMLECLIDYIFVVFGD